MGINVLEAYAAINKDDYVRMNSSSGGLFSLFSEYIIKKLNGVVYGVAMSSDCESAEFIRVDNLCGINKLRGSKYVQAIIGDTFKKVKCDLEKEKYVLFSGTPCQIIGLKMFLGKEYNNLLCIDLICHGVPSPLVWEKYKKYIEKQHRVRLMHVNFRCKDKGWSEFGMKEEFDESEFIPNDKNPYMIMFLKNLSLRPSCYNCKAKNRNMSDITLADFWGISDIVPEMSDNKGVSALIIRSEKGRSLFENVRNFITFQKVAYDDIVKYNPSEYKSVEKPILRTAFFKDNEIMCFEELKNKYGVPDKIPYIIRFKRFLKRVLKPIANKYEDSMYGMLLVFEKTKY